MSSIAVKCACGREARHVGALAEAVDLALLADLQRRRAVGVGGDEIAAEIGEGLGGGGLLGRIEPGIDHHQLGGDLRVDRLRGQGERVHPHHDFGDLERAEIADHPVFDICPAIVPTTARPS